MYTAWSVVFGEQPSTSKWNILGTNDASFADGTGISDGVIKPEHLVAGTGTTFVPQTWNPVFVNWAIGTGGSAGTTAKYCVIGEYVFWYMTTTLGNSGFAVTPNANFTMPVEIHSEQGSSFPLGKGILNDVSVGAIYDAGAIQNSSTTALFTVYNASATHLTVSGINGTVPITFAAGDNFRLSGFYRGVF